MTTPAKPLSPPPPPRWSRDELEARRQEAIGLFREDRIKEDIATYGEFFDEDRGAVEELLEATVDLKQLADQAEAVLGDAGQLRVARYLCAPPVSEDDLAVLIGDESTTISRGTIKPQRLKAEKGLRDRVVSVIQLAVDHRRFPWMIESREPSVEERNSAILATAALMASARLQTNRRHEGKRRQEQDVRDALIDLGFKEIKPREIKSQAKAPRPGEFCKESKLGTRKADLVVGLWNERILAIECKVSNSALNSIKRLNNDAAAKAKRWIQEFGDLNVIPTAVLSGVFDLNNLERAQGDSLTLIWAHHLSDLTAWISQTRPSAG